MKSSHLFIPMTLLCITPGIARHLSYKLSIMNFWVMVRANSLRNLQMELKILILKKFVFCLCSDQLAYSVYRSSILWLENRCTCDLSEFSDNHTSMFSTSWYKPGQTPGSVLGEVSSSMEECRAETVALYRKSGPWTSILLIPLFSGLVVSEPAILKIFNVGGQKLLWSNQCSLCPLSIRANKMSRIFNTSRSCSWLGLAYVLSSSMTLSLGSTVKLICRLGDIFKRYEGYYNWHVL